MIIERLEPSDDVNTILLDGETGVTRDVVLVFSMCERKSAQGRKRVEDPMMVDRSLAANRTEEGDAVRQLVVTGHVRERGRRGVSNKPKPRLYAAESLLVDPQFKADVA